VLHRSSPQFQIITSTTLLLPTLSNPNPQPQPYLNQTGPDWPLFDPATPYELAALQLGSGIHLCPSEREGYGLYIAEAMAAGALVIATNHPPMNELVTNATGLLIEPERAFSQPGPPVAALAKYGNISASVSPEVRVDCWVGQGGWDATCGNAGSLIREQKLIPPSANNPLAIHTQRRQSAPQLSARSSCLQRSAQRWGRQQSAHFTRSVLS